MRLEVQRLCAWHPLPPEMAWEETDIDAFASDIEAVRAPVSAQEAQALSKLLDRPYDDSVFGVLRGVLDLIETTDHAIWQPQPADESRYWLWLLWNRWQNYLRLEAPGPDS